VKSCDLAGANAGAHLASAAGVVMTGGVDNGEPRQERLQIQPQMTLGGGFAAAMLRPVQTGSDPLEGGGVHHVDAPAER